jgi:hypothetical protein
VSTWSREARPFDGAAVPRSAAWRRAIHMIVQFTPYGFGGQDMKVVIGI